MIMHDAELYDLTHKIQVDPDHVSPVATGGYSDVYKAFLDDKCVAVKVLRYFPSTDEQITKKVGPSPHSLMSYIRPY